MLCPKIFCVVFFIQTRLAKKVMYIYISNELQHWHEIIKEALDLNEAFRTFILTKTI